jgi:hypothetical protein
MTGQMSIFDFIKQYEMYDGLIVVKTRTLNILGGRIKIIKGQLFYLISKSKDGYSSIATPNEYGGSFGFPVTEKQFIENFHSVNHKVYPLSEEIWTGEKWIENPPLCKNFCDTRHGGRK